MRTLKTIINTAKLRGVIGDGYDPFNAVSFSKYRKVKTRKRALSRLDFKKIESIEIEPCTRKFDSRNYFVFSYYAGGVNFVDLAQLKWSNIENDQLVYTRRKTNEIIQLPLLGGAQEILDYYKAWHDGNPDAYVFPILDERIHQSEVSINNRIHKVNNQMNKDLQEIASDLNIQVKVTSYVARHTFATVMKYQGVPVSMIGQALGHENEKTTQIYLDSFGSEMMKEAFKKL
jgi:integrase